MLSRAFACQFGAVGFLFQKDMISLVPGLMEEVPHIGSGGDGEGPSHVVSVKIMTVGSCAISKKLPMTFHFRSYSTSIYARRQSFLSLSLSEFLPYPS